MQRPNTLPIVEKWDCHQCAVCCRGTTIPLDEQDQQRLREQHWEDTPEFRNQKTTVRSALMGGQFVLAKKDDGSCVFLGSNDRCRIHEVHGAAAKPSVCRIFPFHLVPEETGATLTALRSCPSAAGDRGRPTTDHVDELAKHGPLFQADDKRTTPPAVAVGARRSWSEFRSAADAIARIISDANFPMVRRMVHAVQFCQLLSDCKLARVDEDAFNELIEMLESSCTQGAGDWFRDRQQPSRSSRSLLRQTALHYIRSHPHATIKETLGSRWKGMWQSFAFARGQGVVPDVGAGFSPTTFDDLERELGPLPADVSEPLNRYYETHTQSKLYAFVNRHRTLVASFYCLAFTYPIALWMVRLAATGREPARADLIDLVVAIERGQGLSTLATLANSISESDQLPRMIAWYAR